MANNTNDIRYSIEYTASNGKVIQSRIWYKDLEKLHADAKRAGIKNYKVRYAPLAIAF